jgi:hypothetical protein
MRNTGFSQSFTWIFSNKILWLEKQSKSNLLTA